MQLQDARTGSPGTKGRNAARRRNAAGDPRGSSIDTAPQDPGLPLHTCADGLPSVRFKHLLNLLRIRGLGEGQLQEDSRL